MIDLLLKRISTGLLWMLSRSPQDSLRKRLLTVVSIRLVLWRTVRLQRSVALLLTQVTQQKEKELHARKWIKSSVYPRPAPTVKESKPADDLWLTETYTSVLGTQTEEPKPGLDAKALIQQELGGEEIEMCVHGTRLLKQGTSKVGKPYKGYVCGVTVPGKQCAPIWYILSPSGQFIRPKEAGDV